MANLENRHQRIVYLVTYSRADIAKFVSRQSFAEAVVGAWRSVGIKVLHWVVSIEGHAVTTNDEQMNNYHFHMALKLEKRARWLRVRKYLDDTFGIQVNFSDSHSTYFSAYRYVTKEDKEALHSQGHPDLNDATPRTAERAIESNKRKGKKVVSGPKKKSRKVERLSVYDVVQIIQARKINSRLELVCLAVSQNREGKTSLAEFIANKGSKAVDEAIALAKEFGEAEAKLARSKKTREQLLEESRNGPCSVGCQGQWLQSARKLLESHGIIISAFCKAVYTALTKGRGKYQNIYIHGPANSGKTFILSPLKLIYKAFCNPATGSFAWMGAEEAEIIFLNDFRWNPTIISWADFLRALEGDTVHLPVPKNFCKQDIELSSDTPFFATSDAPLLLVKGGSIDHANTEMMQVRWRFFHFWKQIPRAEQKSLAPCGKCFAELILANQE